MESLKSLRKHYSSQLKSLLNATKTLQDERIGFMKRRFVCLQVSERSERAFEEDEKLAINPAKMATDIMATSTTELTLFHSIRLARSLPPAPLKMRLASLGAE